MYAFKGEVIRATNCCNLQRNIVALQVEKRCCTYCTTHLKHCHATKFVVASWKNLLKKVDASSTCCNMLLQLATMKFCCATMFEVGGNTPNTWNNDFQLATQQCCVKVEGKCCPYYRALSNMSKCMFVLWFLNIAGWKYKVQLKNFVNQLVCI